MKSVKLDLIMHPEPAINVTTQRELYVEVYWKHPLTAGAAFIRIFNFFLTLSTTF